MVPFAVRLTGVEGHVIARLAKFDPAERATVPTKLFTLVIPNANEELPAVKLKGERLGSWKSPT